MLTIIWPILIKALVGFGILLVIAFIFNYQNKFGTAKNIFFIALLYLFIQSSMMIFKSPGLNYPKQCGFHLLAMMLTLFPTLLFSGWFPHKKTSDKITLFFILMISCLILYMFFLVFSKLISF